MYDGFGSIGEAKMNRRTRTMHGYSETDEPLELSDDEQESLMVDSGAVLKKGALLFYTT